MFLLVPIVVFVGLAVFLTRYFLAHDRGEREPIGALWLAFGLGFVSMVPAVILESLLVSSRYAGGKPQHADGGLLVAVLTVGAVEEICKFAPAALFLFKKRYFNEHTDGIIYFALAGLGFGLPENILYTMVYGTGTGVTRLIFTPFFHAAITGMVGYFLVKVKLDRRPAWTVGAALAAAVVLHGLYDFGAFVTEGVYMVLSMMITLGMTAALFVLFMRAGELDRAVGLSTVGHNSFCRSCGFPNPKHNLYCQHCGQRA